MILDPVYLSPSTAPQVLRNADAFGFLESPKTGVRTQVKHGATWAMDNQVFTGHFNEDAWRTVLQAHTPHREQCLFIVVPDVVGDTPGTLACFTYYAPTLAGWPLAIATQDGMTTEMIPWSRIDALFIGGTDRHKLDGEADALIAEARRRRLWIHVGRVNSPTRMHRFQSAHSWDGTTISREPEHAHAIATTVRELRAMRHGRSLWEIS